MHYGAVLPGSFIARPNRFVARVELEGKEEICHVKNTGRCRELLQPGARVWCRFDGNPNRKTHYDLIAVEKAGRLINIDSQAPNRVTEEWLAAGGLGPVEALRREWQHGDSRFDFSFLQNGRRCLLEVKGVDPGGRRRGSLSRRSYSAGNQTFARPDAGGSGGAWGLCPVCHSNEPRNSF